MINDGNITFIPDSSYTKGPDTIINTKWGEKDCDYYYYEYSGSPYYKEELYVGKDDQMGYLMKFIFTYPDYTEYVEYVLEEYVLS